MKILANISRFLLGLIFAVLGLNGLSHFILGVLFVSNYLLVTFALQLISGVLLLINRYVPFAVTILSPIMMNVLLYGLLMNPAGFGFAFFVAILWVVVLVSVRSAFAGIFEARVETQPVRSRAHRARLASAAWQLTEDKVMSRTIEAIMRHTAPPSNGGANQRNGTPELEREFTVKKRHYVWSEARFVRALMPFHSDVRVAYDGKEVDGKSVLDLVTLAPPEGSTVRVRAEGSDAAEAMHALEELIRSHPDENKKAA